MVQQVALTKQVNQRDNVEIADEQLKCRQLERRGSTAVCGSSLVCKFSLIIGESLKWLLSGISKWFLVLTSSQWFAIVGSLIGLRRATDGTKTNESEMVGKVERAIRFSVKPEIAPAQETTRTPAEAAESEAPSVSQDRQRTITTTTTTTTTKAEQQDSDLARQQVVAKLTGEQLSELLLEEASKRVQELSATGSISNKCPPGELPRVDCTQTPYLQMEANERAIQEQPYATFQSDRPKHENVNTDGELLDEEVAQVEEAMRLEQLEICSSREEHLVEENERQSDACSQETRAPLSEPSHATAARATKNQMEAPNGEERPAREEGEGTPAEGRESELAGCVQLERELDRAVPLNPAGGPDGASLSLSGDQIGAERLEREEAEDLSRSESLVSGESSSEVADFINATSDGSSSQADERDQSAAHSDQEEFCGEPASSSTLRRIKMNTFEDVMVCEQNRHSTQAAKRMFDGLISLGQRMNYQKGGSECKRTGSLSSNEPDEGCISPTLVEPMDLATADERPFANVTLVRRSGSSASSSNFRQTLVCSVSPTGNLNGSNSDMSNSELHPLYPIDGHEFNHCKAAFRENKRIIQRQQEQARSQSCTSWRQHSETHGVGSQWARFNLDFLQQSQAYCSHCKQRLYPVDKLDLDFTRATLNIHRNCFKCQVCSTLLRLETYAAIDAKLYCPAHTKCTTSSR